MWEISLVINYNYRDALLEEELTIGFLKVTIVYFVLLILMSKGYCRAFVLF